MNENPYLYLEMLLKNFESVGVQEFMDNKEFNKYAITLTECYVA